MNIFHTGLDFEVTPVSAEGMAIINEILWAVAGMVNHHGFLAIAAGSLTIGLIIVGTKAVQAQKFDFAPLMLGLFLFVSFFATTGTVHLKNPNTGLIEHTVDRVPLGVALPSSFISGATHLFTDIMKSTYSSVSTNTEADGLTHEKLRTILSFRRAVQQSFGTASVSDSNGGSAPSQSIKNYVENCVIADNQNPTVSEVMKSPNPIAAMQSTWGTSYVSIDLPVPQGQGVFSCYDAYPKVRAFLEATGSSSVYRKFLMSPEVVKTSANRDEKADQVSAYIDSLLMSYTSSTKFMQNIYLYETLDLAKQASLESSDPAMAKILADAREQRLITSMADEQLFNGVIWKTASVLEGLIYALLPLTVFLVMMGSSGIKVVISYLLVIAWLGLWQPIMLLVNFMIETNMVAAIESYASSYVAGFDDLGSLTQSPEGVYGLYREISRIYTSGTELLIATPLIAMALVSGSMFTLSSVAKGVSSSSAEVDTKEMAPTSGKQGYGGSEVKSIRDANGNSTVALGESGVSHAADTREYSVSEQDAVSEQQAYQQAIAAKESTQANVKASEQRVAKEAQTRAKTEQGTHNESVDFRNQKGKMLAHVQELSDSNKIDKTTSDAFKRSIQAGINPALLQKVGDDFKRINSMNDGADKNKEIKKLGGKIRQQGGGTDSAKRTSEFAMAALKGGAFLKGLGFQYGLSADSNFSLTDAETLTSGLSSRAGNDASSVQGALTGFANMNSVSKQSDNSFALDKGLARDITKAKSAEEAEQVSKQNMVTAQKAVSSNAKFNGYDMEQRVLNNKNTRGKMAEYLGLEESSAAHNDFMQDDDKAKRMMNHHISASDNKYEPFKMAEVAGILPGFSSGFNKAHNGGQKAIGDARKGIQGTQAGIQGEHAHLSAANQAAMNKENQAFENTDPSKVLEAGKDVVNGKYQSTTPTADERSEVNNLLDAKTGHERQKHKEQFHGDVPLGMQNLMTMMGTGAAAAATASQLGEAKNSTAFNSVDVGRQNATALVNALNSGTINEAQFNGAGGNAALVKAVNGGAGMSSGDIEDAAKAIGALNAVSLNDMNAKIGTDFDAGQLQAGVQNIRNSVNGQNLVNTNEKEVTDAQSEGSKEFFQNIANANVIDAVKGALGGVGDILSTAVNSANDAVKDVTGLDAVQGTANIVHGAYRAATEEDEPTRPAQPKQMTNIPN